MKVPLDIEFDVALDTVTINGMQYSCEIFREFGLQPLDPDKLFKIVSNDTGIVVVQVVKDHELSHQFNLVAKAGI